MTDRLLPILCIAVFCFAGCAPKPADLPLSPTESNMDLIELLKDENGLDVVTNEFDRTFWIYLPMEESLFKMEIDPNGASQSPDPTFKPTLKFFEAIFKDRAFRITYDITPEKSYGKSFGYKSAYSESYTANQRNILSAIYRVYGSADDPPDFFVIVIADIETGLKMETVLAFEDLKRASVDNSFYEEYSRRVIGNQPVGDARVIGDRTSQHIDYYDLTWAEFIAKQITYRATYKYQMSAFPPSDDARAEVLAIAADAVAAYAFDQFDSVVLKDLNAGATFTIPKADLAAHQSETLPQSKGRLIHIRFDSTSGI